MIEHTSFVGIFIHREATQYVRLSNQKKSKQRSLDEIKIKGHEKNKPSLCYYPWKVCEEYDCRQARLEAIQSAEWGDGQSAKASLITQNRAP